MTASEFDPNPTLACCPNCLSVMHHEGEHWVTHPVTGETERVHPGQWVCLDDSCETVRLDGRMGQPVMLTVADRQAQLSGAG